MATMFRSSLVFPALSKGFLRPPTKPATCRPCIRQQFYSTPPLLGRLTDVIREDHRDLGAYCQGEALLVPGTQARGLGLRARAQFPDGRPEAAHQDGGGGGPGAAEDLAWSFERTKMFTPTRSHPSAPNKPPFETVVGLMEAPLDKLRDLFATFPTEEEKAKAKAKADS